MSRSAVKELGSLYTSLSWAYSPGAWLLSGGLYYRWTFAAERFIDKEPVLDAGCGRGHLLTRLAERGLEVIGVDISPQMARAAQRRLDRKGANGIVVCADARCLPILDESIGTIINAFPMQYVSEERTWNEYLRVLRPGGRWILVTLPLFLGLHPRLIGWYLFRVVEFAVAAGLGYMPSTVTIPTSLFPRQRKELVPVGPTHAIVKIFEKE